MSLKPATQEWIDYAERDFQAVQVLLDAPKIPFEIVAYHCQQSAEKYLKAVLIENDATVPFIHDLLTLNREAQNFMSELKRLEKACELLTPFGTATRYPGSAMAIGQEHMASVTAWAESIRMAVRSGLNTV